MRPSLFAHPFASYCQKVLIALYENGTNFIYRTIGPGRPHGDERIERALAPEEIPRAARRGANLSGIEHHHRAFRIPPPRRHSTDSRRLCGCARSSHDGSFFDNYVMTPMQRIVADFLRVATDRDPLGPGSTLGARFRLWVAGWRDGNADWAGGGDFSWPIAPPHRRFSMRIGFTRFARVPARARLAPTPAGAALDRSDRR